MRHSIKAAVLLFMFLICGAGFVITQRVREQVTAPAPRELFAIVNQQLTAFRTADFQAAYQQAATGVQQRFTVVQFEKMVRQRYPDVVRGSRVEFGQVKVRGSNAIVQVFIVHANGATRSFLYSLTHEENAWRIDDVEELRRGWPGPELSGTHA